MYNKKRISKVYNLNVKKIKEIEFYNRLLSDVGNFTQDDETNISYLLKNDSLLKYPIFRDFIKSYTDFSHQISYVGKVNNQKKESTKGFDVVFNSNEFGPKIKNYLLFFYLEDIAKYSPSNVSDLYKQKFSAIKGNDISQYESIIKRKYTYDKNTSAIVLKSANNQTKTLDALIKENKGKIIYIDFWASWCLPCRKTMPSSKKLRAEFENKEIVFIYLSIDKDFDKWVSANTKEGLSFYKSSYIIANQDNSEAFKKLGIQTIPRYLIYDKIGKLIYPNAPSPESSEIKKELNLLLAKQ